jgi:hypothetical protein
MHEMVPIILFLSFFGLIFGIFYIRSRENMAMLEKGLNPRQNARVRITPRPFTSLKFGLLLTGAGLGLFAAYLLDNLVFAHRIIIGTSGLRSEDFIDTKPLYPALIGIGGGIGLIISYIIERKFQDKQKEE